MYVTIPGAAPSRYAIEPDALTGEQPWQHPIISAFRIEVFVDNGQSTATAFLSSSVSFFVPQLLHRRQAIQSSSSFSAA